MATTSEHSLTLKSCMGNMLKPSHRLNYPPTVNVLSLACPWENFMFFKVGIMVFNATFNNISVILRR